MVFYSYLYYYVGAPNLGQLNISGGANLVTR